MRSHPKSRDARLIASMELDLLFFVLLMPVALAFQGCAPEMPPPPYYVYFDAGVPADERATWGYAAGDWNAASGADVLRVTAEEPDGRCGVVIVQVDDGPRDVPAWTLRGTCLTTIAYVRGTLDLCVAQHEFGHQLLGIHTHVPRTVMDKWGCEYPAVVTPELGSMVRELWGLP